MTVTPAHRLTRPSQVSRRSLLAGAGALSTGLLSTGLLGACSKNPSASSDNGFAVGDGTFTRIAPDRRATLPTLSGRDLDGKELTTADRAGRVLILNVWGSWCSPCRAEAPHLVEAAAQTTKVADFLGINTRDLDVAPAQSFVRAFKLTYPSFYDPNGELLMSLKDLPPKAIPSTLLVDPQGKIAGRVLGQVATKTLVTAINELAAGQ